MSPLDFGIWKHTETPVNTEEDQLARVILHPQLLQYYHSGLVIINSKEQDGNER